QLSHLKTENRELRTFEALLDQEIGMFLAPAIDLDHPEHFELLHHIPTHVEKGTGEIYIEAELPPHLIAADLFPAVLLEHETRWVLCSLLEKQNSHRATDVREIGFVAGLLAYIHDEIRASHLPHSNLQEEMDRIVDVLVHVNRTLISRLEYHGLAMIE